MAPRVLVVEDDPDRRAVLCAALARHGYAPLEAASAREAYRRARAGEADALVVDHTLPDAQGLRLCIRLRQEGLGLPLVLTAAPADAALEAKARARLRLAGWVPAAAGPGAAVQALAAALPPPAASSWRAGSLGPFVLARALMAAWVAGATGTLIVETPDGGRRGLALLAGSPVALLPAAPLAILEPLIADGRLAPHEAEAFEQQPEPALLVKMGVVDPAELTWLEESVLEEGLAALLSLEAGRYSFRTERVAPRVLPPRVVLPRFLFAWARGAQPAGSASRLAGEPAGRLVAPSAAFFDALPFFEAGPDEWQVLALLEEALEGVEPAALLGEDAEGSAGYAARAVCLDALDCLGLLERLDTPRPVPLVLTYPRRRLAAKLAAESSAAAGGGAPGDDFVDIAEELASEVSGALATLEAGPVAAAGSRPAVPDAERAEREAALREEHRALAAQTYYEVFGLTAATYSYEAVREAYFAKLKRFTPDFFVQAGSDGEVVSMAEAVVAKLATAYNTLSNFVAKENYDRLLAERSVRPSGNREEDALQAEVQYQSGEAFLAQGDFEAAERALTTALDLEPRPEGYAHLAWAVFRNPRNQSSRTAIERAKALLTRSLSLKTTADAFAYRGAIFLAEGKRGLAEVEFQKALRLSPEHRLAKREMAALEEQRAAEAKGFFRRLFR